ncbi:Uncharacterised protein [Ectopseudomonas mendocina]|uniref:Uncharacterized protein n=1 Tax=Ectopseudomonas mendocina TaxID=300 RepID=A0A379PRQ8_ECTME|nr:hypothetical protein [Pseudomonas mendocina]SUE95832.1 Uncharacterised protein [Pseudomonas mendocina]
MYRYTPIDLPTLATANVALPKRIDWNLLSFNDAVGTASSILNVVELKDPSASYEASFISCTHNEGKSWESLFIPLDAEGNNGVSVTWWNRNRGLNGQVNVKLSSVSDYYNTVASKAVYKGYEVVAYVGRDRGFTRRQAFVDELANREKSSSPVIAMSRSDMTEISSMPGWREHVGEQMAKALYNHPATIQFFQRLKQKSLLGQTIRDMGTVIENSKHAEMMTAFRETLADLTAMNRTDDFAKGEVYPAREDEKPKAAPKKTELYQAWGAFG